jgi:hypothetical protein
VKAGQLIALQRTLAQRDGSRRRQWLTAIAVGAAATAWVAAGDSLGAAAQRWLWAAGALFAVAMLRIPYVLFWRADASLLARLPLRGRPVFDAALWSAGGVAAQALLPAAMAAAALLRLGDVATVSRHLALALGLAVASGALLPAVAVAAGALVVSGKAAQVLAGLGEGAAPSTSWLGALPGMAAAGVLLLAIDVRGWLLGGRAEVGRAEVLLAGLFALSIASAALARRAAERVVPAMLRDVSALDRQQLATLQLTPPSAALRALGRGLAPPSALLLDKHARLVSRRYPMAGLLGAAASVALLAMALWAPHSWSAVVAVVVGAGGYAAILQNRLHRLPVEQPRLLATLPMSRDHVVRAAQVFALWWWARFVILPGLVLAARAAAPWPLLLLLAAATALLALASRRR